MDLSAIFFFRKKTIYNSTVDDGLDVYEVKEERGIKEDFLGL